MNHRSNEDTDHDMRVGIPLPMPLVDGGEQGEVEQLKGRIDALVFVIDHTRRRLLRVQAGEVSPTGEIMQIVDTLTRAVSAQGEGEGVARLRAALEFYADSRNYNKRFGWAVGQYSPPFILSDRGKIAREALAR